ncbi:MAG: polymorphic toxin type 28 domain-containing protein [Pseudomonadota bacterium]
MILEDAPFHAHDLTVEPGNTYFVGHGKAWVHNCNRLADIASRIDGQMGHITDRDLEAAAREIGGEVVSRKASGTPYDHVQEVADARSGLRRAADQARRLMSNPNISQSIRDQAQAHLSRASKDA